MLQQAWSDYGIVYSVYILYTVSSVLYYRAKCYLYWIITSASILECIFILEKLIVDTES